MGGGVAAAAPTTATPTLTIATAASAAIAADPAPTISPLPSFALTHSCLCSTLLPAFVHSHSLSFMLAPLAHLCSHLHTPALVCACHSPPSLLVHSHSQWSISIAAVTVAVAVVAMCMPTHGGICVHPPCTFLLTAATVHTHICAPSHWPGWCASALGFWLWNLTAKT